MEALRAGIVGCGNISDTYLSRARDFAAIEVVACADLDAGLARTQAEKYGVRALAPEELLAEDAIELVINLTPPLAHAEISSNALAAGKHVYSEKPLGVTLAEARALVAQAKGSGRRVGCAPDTFLGGGHQLSRELLDQGVIGRPIAGTARVMTRGMEAWHPNPSFFFKRGGGPVLDVGPYYATALVNLLGPVEAVAAMAGCGFEERVVGSEARRGERIAVEVATHVEGVLRFVSGTLVSFTATWDVHPVERYRLELFGTEGTMRMPDPNFFGGEVLLSHDGLKWDRQDSSQRPYARPNRKLRTGAMVADYRIIGVVDMAEAIRESRPQRAPEGLALHVLEVLEGLGRAALEHREVAIESRCERPAPLREPSAAAG
jgi:predicted dehydrogenase